MLLSILVPSRMNSISFFLSITDVSFMTTDQAIREPLFRFSRMLIRSRLRPPAPDASMLPGLLVVVIILFGTRVAADDGFPNDGSCYEQCMYRYGCFPELDNPRCPTELLECLRLHGPDVERPCGTTEALDNLDDEQQDNVEMEPKQKESADTITEMERRAKKKLEQQKTEDIRRKRVKRAEMERRAKKLEQQKTEDIRRKRVESEKQRAEMERTAKERLEQLEENQEFFRQQKYDDIPPSTLDAAIPSAGEIQSAFDWFKGNESDKAPITNDTLGSRSETAKQETQTPVFIADPSATAVDDSGRTVDADGFPVEPIRERSTLEGFSDRADLLVAWGKSDEPTKRIAANLESGWDRRVDAAFEEIKETGDFDYSVASVAKAAWEQITDPVNGWLADTAREMQAQRRFKASFEDLNAEQKLEIQTQEAGASLIPSLLRDRVSLYGDNFKEWMSKTTDEVFGSTSQGVSELLGETKENK